MALNLKEIAKKETVFAQLAIDRTLIENDDIIKYYKDGITINAAEEVNVGESRYYVYTFKENHEKFAGSGLVLTKIFDRIMMACEGDVKLFNKELSAGLKIKLTKDTTKNKDENGEPKTIYKVEVVD